VLLCINTAESFPSGQSEYEGEEESKAEPESRDFSFRLSREATVDEPIDQSNECLANPIKTDLILFYRGVVWQIPHCDAVWPCWVANGQQKPGSEFDRNFRAFDLGHIAIFR
jgi:hypothetical protein